MATAAALTLLALAPAAPVRAQDAPMPETLADTQERSSTFGIGFQSSWPAYGFSGLYDIGDRLTAQLVVGPFGNWTTLTGRGLYRLSQQEKYSVYGFGAAGLYRYAYNVVGARASETSVIFGAGGGMEISLPVLFEDDDFPPLFWSVDLGLSFGNFDYYNWRGFSWGSGLHYRF